jgi:hypothetical protein
LWRFSLETETWEAVQISGLAPERRSGSASTSVGDRLYIFGGQGDTEMYGDLYFYDDINQDWTKVSSQSLPSARKHACMCARYPKLFIFGGITLNGYSNEVWIIDIKNFESELLSVNEPGSPQPTAFAGCKAEVENGQLILYVFVGESTGETPLDGVYRFIVRDLQWESLGTIAARSQTTAIKVDQRLIVAAGEEWGVDANNTVVMKDLGKGGEVSVIGITGRAMYSGASIYHKTSLYIFGGGDKVGEKFRSSVPVHNFYKLDLNSNCGGHCDWPCSPGTYEASPGVCETCPEGYYSDEFGPYYIACPAGTYSTRKGNSSLRQCYPCKEGFYNLNPGAMHCKACPAGHYCAVGSSTPSTSSVSSTAITTSQPDLFEPGTSKVASASSQLQLVFLVVACIVVYVILFFKQRVFKAIKYLDLFDNQHNHKEARPHDPTQELLRRSLLTPLLHLRLVLPVTSLLDLRLRQYRGDQGVSPNGDAGEAVR